MARKLKNPIDIHVGARVRMRRKMLSLSQSDLGKAVGITFQQVQKYENGANRISSSRLQQFSNVLKVPIPFFFEGVPTSEKGGEDVAADITQLFSTSEGLTLARSFLKIKSKKTRRQIVEIVDAMASEM